MKFRNYIVVSIFSRFNFAGVLVSSSERLAPWHDSELAIKKSNGHLKIIVTLELGIKNTFSH